MAQRYANLWSSAAARLTGVAHTRASLVRWAVILGLTGVWIIGGMVYWLGQGGDVADALYRTLGAVAMWEPYFETNDRLLEWVRFAALATPVVGLLFAFSGQFGRALARMFNLFAARHVVIAGDAPAALTLALDCRKKRDAVMLIAEGLSEETALNLRRKGVVVLAGDAGLSETLQAARAHHAAHVVAFERDDTTNLQIEAALRRLVGAGRRKPPLSVHVAMRSPVLLRESREMRSAEMRARKADDPPLAIDSKPFSLDEMSARALLQRESQVLLSRAKQLGHERVHLVCFGFDVDAEALAVRVFSSLWSIHFGAPRVTVLAPDAAGAEAAFRARYAEAFATPALWSPDIAFMPFDWELASIGPALMQAVEEARGAPSAAVVATGADPRNIQLAIALKRAGNSGLRWPIPIFMAETSVSEFSRQYASGEGGAYYAFLRAFGAHQANSTRKRVIEGALDRGAAIAHEHYQKGLGKREPMSMRALQAATRDWGEVLETYRAANRAVSDAAMVKMWDAGWRPAGKKEKGETEPAIAEDLLPQVAQREHDRWVAERLIAGWRPTAPGEKRDNDLMAHDKLIPWDKLNEADKHNDLVQVRAGVDIARATHPQGFIRA